MSRQADLLRSAAKEFRENRSPFHGTWLEDNDVTLDECLDLSSAIGLSILMMLYMRENMENTFLTVGVETALELSEVDGP